VVVVRLERLLLERLPCGCCCCCCSCPRSKVEGCRPGARRRISSLNSGHVASTFGIG
jgi:hypothetical protein